MSTVPARCTTSSGTITERVPGGLGEVRRPLVSGAGDIVEATETVPDPVIDSVIDSVPDPEGDSVFETLPVTPEQTPAPVQEDLWLPNAVDDGPPAGNPSANG